MEIIDVNEFELRLDALAEHPENVGKIDTPLPRDSAGDELENGPDVDSEDPNLSAAMAEAGAEDGMEGVGMRDENEMRLDEQEPE